MRLCKMRGTQSLQSTVFKVQTAIAILVRWQAWFHRMIDYAANSFYLGTFDDSVDKTQPQVDIKWLCKKQRQDIS